MNTVSAYVIGVVAAVVMLIIAAIISNMISFRPDNTDCARRRLWFWVLAVLTPVLNFLATFTFVYLSIRVNSKRESYMIAMAISAVASFVLYVVFGFIIAKANKHGKLGNWF